MFYKREIKADDCCVYKMVIAFDHIYYVSAMLMMLVLPLKVSIHFFRCQVVVLRLHISHMGFRRVD